VISRLAPSRPKASDTFVPTFWTAMTLPTKKKARTGTKEEGTKGNRYERGQMTVRGVERDGNGGKREERER